VAKDVGPLIGALFTSVSPKAPKKGRKGKAGGQQHGELASAAVESPKMPSAHQMTRQHAKHEKHRATESWISGHMSTKEHSAVHARADHILRGGKPHEFKGKTGERSFKPLRAR